MIERIFKISLTILILSVLCCSNKGYAQISVKGTPYSFGIEEKSARIVPQLSMETIDIEEQLKYDEENKVENRFAIGESVNISIRDEASKAELDHGTVYQYQINAAGAKSLGLYFEDFQIPDGAELYVYNTARTQLLGAFTSENNKQNGILSIAQLIDDNLIIDYYEPYNADFEGTLYLGKVFKSYREMASVFSTSAARVGINCPGGEDWQDIKHAVLRMLYYEGVSGYYCSGALVNNANFDGTPYFLTANHCISDSLAAASLVTYFNYENSTCTERDAVLAQSLSGSTLKTSFQPTDVTLLELTEYPSVDYQPYFAGWSISGLPAESGVGIHHPGGSPKCISYTNTISSFENEINWEDSLLSPINSHWAVEFYNGTTEQGSSGSPLFNQNGQIVGQLHGGNDEVSFYGKLYYAWNSGGLKQFLNPYDLDLREIEGTFIKTDLRVETEYACIGTPVQLFDISVPESESWEWNIDPLSFEFVGESNANSKNPVVQFLSAGSYSVSLKIKNDFGNDSITYENIILVSDELDVNFANAADQIEICGSELGAYEFTATGAATYDFDFTEAERFDAIVEDNVLSLSLRDQYKRLESFSFSVIVNGTHGDCSDADTIDVDVLIPTNDYIQNAEVLSLGTNTGYTNDCAGVEDLEPEPQSGNCMSEGYWCSDSELLQNTVWFKFYGPSSGIVSVEAIGFDTQIALYGANSEEDLLSDKSDRINLINANDNPLSVVREAKLENVKVKPGKMYWLQVDGNQGITGDLTINLLSNSLEMFPIPADQELSITFASEVDADVTFEIYSLTGNQYSTTELQTQLDENTFSFDVSALPNGIYLVHAIIGNEIFTRRLSILH